MKTPDLSISASKDAVELFENMEASYIRMSKALCGKVLATSDELLQAVDQLKKRLAHADRERDAAVKDLNGLMSQLKGQVCGLCCKHNTEECNWGQHLYHHCTPEWRGVCEENTKEDAKA